MFEVEPPPADEPLLRLDNVIVTPHALCWTDQCFAGNGAADVSAVLDIQHGRVPRGVVNRDVLDSRAFKRRLARAHVPPTADKNPASMSDRIQPTGITL